MKSLTRAPRRLALLAILCATTGIHSAPGATEWEGGDVPRGFLAELAREADAAPAVAPRLSISSGSPARRMASTASGTIVPSGSGFTPGGSAGRGRLIRIVGRAKAALREEDDPGARHALALVDLGWGAGGGKQLDAALSSLRSVARTATHPAPALADLAAAHILRAERAGTPGDLFAAVEAAEEALASSPRNRAALFNRALALHRMELVEEAAHDWRAYLAVDSTSEYAADARRHLRAALSVAPPPRAPAPGAPLAAYAAFAAADPQRARELGLESLLGDWGRAVLDGDEARVERLLRPAEVMGGVLEQRPGGDASLADAVRAVRRQPPGAALRRLAAAHRDFAAGRALYEDAKFDGAGVRLGAAEAGAAGSPALREWASQYHAMTRVHTADSAGVVAGEEMLRAIAAGTDTLRHPALAARARWSLAARLLRSARYEEALARATESARLFARAGERENEGAALEQVMNAQFSLHEADAGYATAGRALARLRPYRGSMRLHNLLFSAGMAASNDGFARAAVRMEDEGVRVAVRRGKPVYEAEARLSRARLLAGAGRLDDAAGEVRAGVAALRLVPDESTRKWLTAEARLATALASVHTNPADAAAVLDSAAAGWIASGAPARALDPLVAAAAARLAAGDGARAAMSLERAFALLEQRRDSIRMEPRRAAVFDAARAMVERLVMLRLAAGDTAGAMGYLDRGRASLAPVGNAPGKEERAVVGPPGEVVLEYALIGDTLLAMTVEGRRVGLSRARVDTVELVRAIGEVRDALEGAGAGRDAGPGLARLHELLIRPLRARLGRAGTPLVVIADGDLALVPFAALLDAGTKRYLVQDHPLRFAVSLAEARRSFRPAGAGEPAVFVADPRFDRRESPGLPRLPGAGAEARTIAREYGGVVLDDSLATARAVEESLAAAGVFHYAGHALFDDERPERSSLVLAPAPGRGGRLTAERLARLELGRAPLVVLAACQTVRAGRGRAGGFSGLAGAFLAAGARGVVGSLWEVDDHLTRPLMTEFHRAYRASADGPAALRAAQLHLLASRNPALRAPAAWAGFRYVGR